MRKVSVSEIRNLAEYELERAAWRPKVIALKERRRIRVGSHLTFLFENHETLRYQIQEMVRIERIVKPEEIASEVEVYNELIPGWNEFSATLLIEYETAGLRKIRLHELLGLENHVWLGVDRLPPVQARFDTRQISTDRLSSVQYLKFPLAPEQAAAFPSGARLLIDHPKYTAEHVLTPAQLAELAADLA